MDIREFTSFLEAALAINVAINVWDAFAKVVTFQRLWQNKVNSVAHQIRTRVLHSLPHSMDGQQDPTVEIEEEIEAKVTSYHKVSLRILGFGKIYGAIAAMTTVWMLWHIGYASSGGETEMAAWVIYTVSILVTLPIPLTLMAMVIHGLMGLCLVVRVRNEKIEGIIREIDERDFGDGLLNRYSPRSVPPHFIVEIVSSLVANVAKEHGFSAVVGQENLETGTYYTIRSKDGEVVYHIFLSNHELTRTLLIGEGKRKRHVERLMFKDKRLEMDKRINPLGRPLREEYTVDFIRESLKTHPLVRVQPSFAFSAEKGDGQGRRFECITSDARKLCLLDFPEARWQALLSARPLDRYAEIRKELFIRLGEIAKDEGWQD